MTLTGETLGLEETYPPVDFYPDRCADYLKYQTVFYDYYNFVLISAPKTSWQLAGLRVKHAAKGGTLFSFQVQEVD